MHALTVDVEDYFHVSAFDGVVRMEDWPGCESRVERNTEKMLNLLADAKVRATFFILGWVAERHPSIVKKIQGEGHEIASHGYGHQVLTAMTREQFRRDIRRAKGILEDLTGRPVLGYRAPSFTIMRETWWALPILVQEGFVYDSSIFPIRHDRYGVPDANPLCHRVETATGPLWEIPPSTLSVMGIRMPIAGGGYFRLIPYRLLRRLLRYAETAGNPLVMYFHPWELDPDQPRFNAPMLSRFRHYVNLHKTECRFIQLLRDFCFGPIRETIAPIRCLVREQVA
ncbi:MAG: polysaccharide deacetylase family protein [Nitrospiraceae bacterium]